MRHLQTIAELPGFIRVADKLLGLSERQELIHYLASHPKAGDLMEGTGGCANCGGVEVAEAKAAE